MPQSLSSLLIHVVFSTKDRAPSLGTAIRPGLHAYLAAVARNAGCECYRVGGTADHVHLAIRLSRTMAVSLLVEALKTSTPKWMKSQVPGPSGFSWQRGYGAISAGHGELGDLHAYIDSQEDHHRIHSFQEEYRSFLAKNGIEYDERYVWD